MFPCCAGSVHARLEGCKTERSENKAVSDEPTEAESNIEGRRRLGFSADDANARHERHEILETIARGMTRLCSEYGC